jgi:4'-phosphopantetheinyl transferase
MRKSYGIEFFIYFLILSNMWDNAPQKLSLTTKDIHIWRANLNLAQFKLDKLRATLSHDEITRAERFYFEKHRHRFIASRGILREILGRYLEIEPNQVRFGYELKGKPFLVKESHGCELNFNVSHSQDLALYAMACGDQVGIDLEMIRPIADVEQLAQRFFSTSETNAIASLVSPHQEEMFFRYWTCKEAYLKATGDGLSSLDQVEIILNPGESPKLSHTNNWMLQELFPGDRYIGAVAFASGNRNLSFWDV